MTRASIRPSPLPPLRSVATHDVVLFDGDCTLCNGWVEFVLRREREPHLRFASLDSAVGRRLLGLAAGDAAPLDSIVLVGADGTRATRSTAVARILAHLRRPWPLLGRLLSAIPRPLRDAGYGVVARVRHRLLPPRSACRVGTPEERARFLDR